jgi:AcrR family transcriptional regulator
MAIALKKRQRQDASIPALDKDALDRKTKIILSAEKLIATYGYHAVNIRQIADEAGVPLGLVRYYYGAKADMFHAIFKRWDHVNQQRLDRLAEVMLDKSRADLLRRIFEAFCLPVLALTKTEEGANYALLLSRELLHPIEEAELAIREFFDPVALAFLAAMHEALPKASKEQLGWGYQFALGALMSHLNRARALRLLDAASAAAPENDPQLLLNSIVGGLNASIAVVRSVRSISSVSSAPAGAAAARKGARR